VAVALPATLISLTSAIDNLWLIASERADQAGKELAKALTKRLHGSRPVTLVGYSMGARVVFACLRELSRLLAQAQALESGVEELGEEEAEEDGQGAEEEAEEAGQGAQERRYMDEAGLPRFESVREALEAGSDAGGAGIKAGADGTEADTGAGAGAGASSGDGVKRWTVSGRIGSVFGFSRRGKSGDKNTESGDKSGDKESGKDGGKGNGGRNYFSRRGVEEEEEVRLSARELKGLVQDVVLLGAPLGLRSKQWARSRELVGGRLINGYCREDMLLSVIYRYQRYKVSVCGVAPVKVAGVENIALDHIVHRHIDYSAKMQEVMREINLAGWAAQSKTTSTSGPAPETPPAPAAAPAAAPAPAPMAVNT